MPPPVSAARAGARASVSAAAAGAPVSARVGDAPVRLRALALPARSLPRAVHPADVEERGVDGLLAIREHRAQQAAALEAHVPAQARALVAAALQVGDALQQGPGHVLVARLAVAAHQSLEGVAAHELLVQKRVLVRQRDDVDADGVPTVQHQHAALTLEPGERRQHLVQIELATRIGVAHGRGVRVRPVLAMQLPDLIPHAPLIRPEPRTPLQ